MSGGPVTIFEGPDGAGKTTLVQAFNMMDSAPVVHVGPPAGSPLHEWSQLLRDHADKVSFDRLHLGEQVYGPIYRGRDALGSFGRKMLERKLAKRFAVVILCLPPYAVARANWAKRKAVGGEMFPDDAGFRKVYDAFMIVKTSLPVVMYDYTEASWKEAFCEVARRRRKAYYNEGASSWLV